MTDTNPRRGLTRSSLHREGNVIHLLSAGYFPFGRRRRATINSEECASTTTKASADAFGPSGRATYFIGQDAGRPADQKFTRSRSIMRASGRQTLRISSLGALSADTRLQCAARTQRPVEPLFTLLNRSMTDLGRRAIRTVPHHARQPRHEVTPAAQDGRDHREPQQDGAEGGE